MLAPARKKRRGDARWTILPGLCTAKPRLCMNSIRPAREATLDRRGDALIQSWENSATLCSSPRPGTQQFIVASVCARRSSLTRIRGRERGRLERNIFEDVFYEEKRWGATRKCPVTLHRRQGSDVLAYPLQIGSPMKPLTAMSAWHIPLMCLIIFSFIFLKRFHDLLSCVLFL